MKRYISFISILLFIGFTLNISSCKKDELAVDPTLGLSKITEGYVIGAATKVAIYSSQSTVSSGYMKFYLMLTDSATGKTIEDAHITLNPMMDMGTMKHSCPFENPVSEMAVNQLFPCAVDFIMSSMGGSWTLGITVHQHNTGKEGTLNVPLTVNEPVKSKIKSFTALDNSSNKFFISLLEPIHPKVGINDIELFIARKASMMSFPADSSLSVTLTPEMPTMGHGSPNNVNPVHVGGGHYKGKVNFTMTGLWRLNLDFMNGAAIADSATYFEIEF